MSLLIPLSSCVRIVSSETSAILFPFLEIKKYDFPLEVPTNLNVPVAGILILP